MGISISPVPSHLTTSTAAVEGSHCSTTAPVTAWATKQLLEVEDKGISLPFIAQIRPLIILQSDYGVPKQEQMHLIKHTSGHCQSSQPGRTGVGIKSRKQNSLNSLLLAEACSQPCTQTNTPVPQLLSTTGSKGIPGTHGETHSALQLEHQTLLQLLHIPNLLQLWTHKEILWQVIHLIYCTSFKSTWANPIIKA